MPDFSSFDWSLGEARVAIYGVAEWLSGDRPAVVMLHGALRAASELKAWPERLREVADVYLVDLPAHGRSTPIKTPSVANMAGVVAEAVAARIRNRDVVVVGESIGGLVALAMAGQPVGGAVRAVLALDPPLTTRKHWIWRIGRLAARREMTRSKPALAAFDREVLGILPDGFEERIYYELIGEAQVPVVIAAGDRSLFVTGGRGPATIFDETDRFVIERLYPGKADVRRIENAGHVLLEDAPQAVVELIGGMLDDVAGRRRALH